MNLIDRNHKGLRPLAGDLSQTVVVLDYQCLGRRFQMPRFQLIKAKGGFGCKEDSDGKIFAICIADGEDISCRRAHLIGIATDELIKEAMADTTPVPGIDLSLREYMLIAKDGSSARGDTVEQARQRLNVLTDAKTVGAYELHPESYLNEFGYISYPAGAPPVEIGIRKGRTWTARH